MEKKKRDYVYLLITMILSFISLHVFYKLGERNHIVWLIKLSDLVAFVVVVLWHVFLYRITSNFYRSSFVRWAYALLLVAQICLITFVHTRENVPVAQFAVFGFIGYAMFFSSFCVVFFILLKDIFLQKHDMTYSLLGATNIYLLIGVIFSHLYSMIAVFYPQLIGADPMMIKTVMYYCSEFSWHTLAGSEYPGEVDEVIKSIAVLESLTADLFIVFVVGRLMTN